jgi:hypothetical protein
MKDNISQFGRVIILMDVQDDDFGILKISETFDLDY